MKFQYVIYYRDLLLLPIARLLSITYMGVVVPFVGLLSF